MKIAFLYDRIFPESIGGVEHRNLELGKALAHRGHSVVIAGPTDRTRQIAGVDVQPFPLTPSWTGPHRFRQVLPWIVALRRFPVEEFDLIETANIPIAHLFSLDRQCRRAGVPLLVTWHEFWGSYWRDQGFLAAPLLELIERVAALKGTAVCAVSGLMARRVAAVRGGTLPVVPNGVDTKMVSSAVSSGEPNEGQVVFCGRLIPEKRIDLLLRALAILRGERKDARLTIIGDGPDLPRLRNIAQDLSITSSVEFHPPLARIEEVWQECSRALLAVQPSSREGFGMFPLEAMALGLPVVFCRSPNSAVGEIVRHGREGLAVEPQPEALAAALKKLLSDHDLRRSLSRNAENRALQFDWEKIALSFEKLVTR